MRTRALVYLTGMFVFSQSMIAYADVDDGEFSHCGVDSVDLVKIEGEWKIANFMWTVERENCPTAPSD